MSRFFGKKKGAATEDDEVNRSNLFGGRTAQNPPSNSNSGHAAGNPYAQRGGYDSGYGGAPPADYGRRGENGYGGSYGGSSYAAQNPYAPQRDGDRYDSPNDPDRERLFGARKQGDGGDDGYSRPQYPNEPKTGSGGEDEEEEDIRFMKAEIAHEKKKTVSSTQNALMAARRAEESGRATLERLGMQGERLHNTEKNLDIAANQNRIAEEKARELKNYNRSMFVPHVSNPLRSSARAREEEAKILARHHSDREERDKTREFGYDSRNRVGRALNDNGRVESKTTTSLAERSRYQFEADESDDEKERAIADNLDQLGAITGRLKGLAMATGTEVDRQNVQIKKIMEKVRYPFTTRNSLTFLNTAAIAYTKILRLRPTFCMYAIAVVFTNVRELRVQASWNFANVYEQGDHVDDQIALNHSRIRKIH